MLYAFIAVNICVCVGEEYICAFYLCVSVSVRVCTGFIRRVVYMIGVHADLMHVYLYLMYENPIPLSYQCSVIIRKKTDRLNKFIYKQLETYLLVLKVSHYG